ncbi:WYL domain-containing protein [Sinorhizobium fredii]|uniref:WYL domain-containing protein n=1 Tax=Rhizobium fredii TaxID=380 RepID=UPI0035110727
MALAGAGLKWGVERRLEFIEFRLFWEGGVNRADIIEMFDVSVPQASKDLTLYQERAPHNAIYDKSAKRYVTSENFEPCFLKPDPHAYLSQLRSVAEGILDRSDSWIGSPPPYDAAPTPVRGVNARTLRSIVTAIRRMEAIEVKYQSLSRPEAAWRWITPHAIGFDGFRWHTRAYCEIDQTFKDFLLSRVLETRGARTSKIESTADRGWQEHVVLEVGPHPDLSETQKKVIALDYGMSSGKANIRVRRAFLYYTLKRLGLDSNATARRPQDQQIVLLNPHVLASEPMSLGMEG